MLPPPSGHCYLKTAVTVILSKIKYQVLLAWNLLDLSYVVWDFYLIFISVELFPWKFPPFIVVPLPVLSWKGLPVATNMFHFFCPINVILVKRYFCHPNVFPEPVRSKFCYHCILYRVWLVYSGVMHSKYMISKSRMYRYLFCFIFPLLKNKKK